MKFPHLSSKLDQLKNDKAFRQSRSLDVAGHVASIGQRQLVNFSSNDYLGLTGNAQLQQSFFEQSGLLKDNWMSASSSRPLTGTSASHSALESLLAASYNKQGALLFNSGYHANTGILPAITDERDLILADKLVHASLIDGLKLCGANFKRFAHNDLDHLELLLAKHSADYRTVWVVTESLFSMDGDYAPLKELVELKKKFEYHLYVDEAHAVGCIGTSGLGLAEKLDLIDDVDLIVGTFGKALAGVGGFVVADQVLIESMINFSRSWLFSTALPPINIDWNIFIWQQLSTFADERNALAELSKAFKYGLREAGKEYLGDSYIVPILEPGNDKVVALSAKLEGAGILAMPIRSPTVKIGSERIRFSLTANIPESSIAQCLNCLNEL